MDAIKNNLVNFAKIPIAKFFKYYFILSLPFILISVALYQIISNQVLSENQLRIEDELKRDNGFLYLNFHENINVLVDSFRSTIKSRRLNDYLNEPSEINYRSLVERFNIKLGLEKQIIRIRVISPEGQELVKVKRDLASDKVVENQKLINLSEQDLYQFAKTLPTKTIKPYKVDLYKENLSYRRPYTPVLTIVSVLENSEQQITGYFVSDVNIGSFLDQLVDMVSSDEFRYEVINEQGFYLYSDERNKLFGNILSERKHYNLALENARLWREIQAKESDVLTIEEQVYAFQKSDLVDFTPDTEKGQLTFVSTLNKQVLFAEGQRKLDVLTKVFWPITFIVMIANFPLAFILYNRQRFKHIEALLDLEINSMSAYAIVDGEGRILRINPAFVTITGFGEEDAIHKRFEELSEENSGSELAKAAKNLSEAICPYEGELSCYNKVGGLIEVQIKVHAVKSSSGSVRYYVVNFIDITERKQLERDLEKLSVTDALTQCFNRRYFEIQSTYFCEYLSRNPEQVVSFALLDIDHFKKINDSFGHHVGDQVLAKFAQLLKASVRETDIVTRIGGEEFGVLMPNTDVAVATMVMERFRKSLEANEEQPIYLCSTGVTQIRLGESIDKFYSRADKALYQAKENGRNCVIVQ